MAQQDVPTGTTVQVSHTPTCAVVAVNGSLGIEHAEGVRDRLREVVDSGHANVLVDLAGVTEIDSRGLAALVGTLKQAREHGGSVRCCGASAKVFAVFQLTHLDHVLAFFPDRDRALRQPWERARRTDG